MKYILSLLLLTTVYTAQAQFTGTDSLRNYNNRFITNNASQAFTNLRLHNLLAGIIDFIDSAQGGSSVALGVDTMYVTADSVFHYKKNGVFRSFIIRGNPGASSIYRIPFSNGAGRFSADSNFLFDKSQGNDATRLIVGPTVVNDGGLSKINATSDNMNALALTSYGTGLNTIIFRRALGTINTPLVITAGKDLWNFSGRGYTGTVFTGSRASIYAQTSQDWTDSTQGTVLYFATTANDSITMRTRMTIDNNGRVYFNSYPVLTKSTDTTSIKPLGYDTLTGKVVPMALWPDGTNVKNGLYKIGDTVKLGTVKTTAFDNTLDSTILIQVGARRHTGTVNKNVLITNAPVDSSQGGSSFWLYPSIASDFSQQPKALNVNLFYKEAWGDTLNLQYNGPINSYWFMKWDSAGTRYKQPGGKDIAIPYTGIQAVNRIFLPRDSVNIFAGANGYQAGEIIGDWAMGDSCGYNAYIYGTTQPNYPLAVFKSHIDLQRNLSRGRKRNFTGNGIAGYFADFKDYQGGINGSTFQDGSYHNKIYDYYSAGLREGEAPVTGSVAKSYLLGISNNDTVIGFYSAPKYDLNNLVNNGFGFVQRGIYDFNWFQGKTTFGGTTMPTWLNTPNNNFYRVHIDSTLLIGNNKVGTAANPDTTSYIAAGWQQYGLTHSAFITNATKKKGLWLTFDNSWNSTNNSTDYSNTNCGGLWVWTWVRANDSVYLTGNGTTGGGLTGGEMGLILRKNTGFTDTTRFIGGATPGAAPTGFQVRVDAANSVPVGGDNLYDGYYAAITPTFNFFGSRNQMQNAIWLNLGINQAGSTGTLTTGYQAYFNSFGSNVTNKYAIYQAGTADTNYFAGPVRAPNLVSQTDTTNYKPVAVNSAGSLTKMSYWPNSKGYQVYTCLLTQSGTAAPTATILENSIGSIVWTRSSAGIYVGTLSSAFTANKTWLQANWSDESASGNIVFQLKRTSSNTVQLLSSSDGINGFDVFTNLSIEIRVYP